MHERSATLRSLAKINLDLRVLYKRPDNYHELRTVFHTISVADTIRIRYITARRTRLLMDSNVDIPRNLILRAAEAVLDNARLSAEIHFGLDKRIPMGAGLGGGSTNAAAILLALPVLAGIHVPIERLTRLGSELGSDVPFFLYGGAALGIGRGEELYPLPDLAPSPGLLIAPGIHVSTAEAYAGLERPALTSAPSTSDTESFRSLVWAVAARDRTTDWKKLCTNDFEPAVFNRHPVLNSLKSKLIRRGARPAMMTGSGSALFGLFESRNQREDAMTAFSAQHSGAFQVLRMSLVTQRRYRALWRRQLSAHITSELAWPPASRYHKQ